MLKDHFDRWMMRSGETLASAAFRIGVSPITLSRWIHGHAEPRPKNVLPMAELLGVDADVLLEQTRKKVAA